MNGVEVRIVQLRSRDTDIGSDGLDDENCGAVELWRDGERIVELTWWESFAPLPGDHELHAHLTHDGDVRFRADSLNPRTPKGTE